MPRSFAIIRASAAAVLVAAALVGCTQAPSAAPTSTCAGSIKKVLLADASATTVTSFDAADVPKIFAIPGSPPPSCYYTTITTPPAINGVTYTVTHRTLLYVGLSDANAAALVAALRKTASVAPWSVSYDNAPAPPAAGATAPAIPVSESSSALWEYNVTGAPTDDKGSFGYYEATPLAAGTATHAGLPQAVNVVRIETELRHPK